MPEHKSEALRVLDLQALDLIAETESEAREKTAQLFRSGRGPISQRSFTVCQ